MFVNSIFFLNMFINDICFWSRFVVVVFGVVVGRFLRYELGGLGVGV